MVSSKPQSSIMTHAFLTYQTQSLLSYLEDCGTGSSKKMKLKITPIPLQLLALPAMNSFSEKRIFNSTG